MGDDCKAGVSSRRGGCMVIFGGVGLGADGEARTNGDTWTLQVPSAPTLALPNSADEFRSDVSPKASPSLGGARAVWKRPVLQGGAPAKRLGHCVCLLDGGDRTGSALMLLCGGFDDSGSPLSDCWVLELDDMRWVRVEVSGAQSVPPPMLSSTRGRMPSALSPAMPLLSGRCLATYSDSEGVAVVWGGRKFYRLNEPDGLRRSRGTERGGLLRIASEPKFPPAQAPSLFHSSSVSRLDRQGYSFREAPPTPPHRRLQQLRHPPRAGAPPSPLF